jgi:hypothetical protein
MAAESTARVDILTTDWGILAMEATGLPGPIQAARVVVTCGVDSRSHVVVRAAAPPWHLPPDGGEIWRIFPADTVTCVRSEAAGTAIVSCSSDDDATLFAAAAATATLMRSWGWDESATIQVRFVPGSASFTVDPVFEDGAWYVKAA